MGLHKVSMHFNIKGIHRDVGTKNDTNSSHNLYIHALAARTIWLRK